MKKKIAVLIMATTLALSSSLISYADIAQETQAEVQHSENYDPEHPLAGKIDEWNLRLPYQYIGPDYICNNNVQSMLTGQLDQYYISPVGYSTDSLGNKIYTTQEAYDTARANEQALYQWFCNWLNGMDFENMSEMDKAKEIQNILSRGTNVILTAEDLHNGKSAEYSILIDKEGNCTEYAMTAMSLAKALGLKSAVSGTGDHAVYYIQVDGKAYFGQNNVLNLNNPTPDTVFFQ